MTHAFFKAFAVSWARQCHSLRCPENRTSQDGRIVEQIPTIARTFLMQRWRFREFFPFAGFFSKDESSGAPSIAIFFFVAGRVLVTAGMTAFYMFRLFFLAFSGYTRADEHVKNTSRIAAADDRSARGSCRTHGIGEWIGWPGSLGGENRFERFLELFWAAPYRRGERCRIAHHAKAKSIC